jgi:hypothetical protein
MTKLTDIIREKTENEFRRWSNANLHRLTEEGPISLIILNHVQLSFNGTNILQFNIQVKHQLSGVGPTLKMRL